MSFSGYFTPPKSPVDDFTEGVIVGNPFSESDALQIINIPIEIPKTPTPIPPTPIPTSPPPTQGPTSTPAPPRTPTPTPTQGPTPTPTPIPPQPPICPDGAC